MTYAYGAIKPSSREEHQFFAVSVKVLDAVISETNDRNNRKIWPHYPILFFREDTNEEIARIALKIPKGMMLDESNVFDMLEYIVFNYGETTLNAHDRRYNSEIDGYHNVILRRAVGCRHFTFAFKMNPTVEITSSDIGYTTESNRHEIKDTLLVRARTDQPIQSWYAGTTLTGFECTIKLETGKDVVYKIPFAFPATPREISKRQIVTTKTYNADPSNFAQHPGRYDPHAFIKTVHKGGFWYLKSMDGVLIITLIKDAWMQAMSAVFTELKTLDKNERERLELVYSEWLARASMNYSGKERHKSIILDSISMLARIDSVKEELETQKADA